MSFYSKVKKSTDTNYFISEEQNHPLSGLCFRDCTKWKVNIKTSENQTLKSVSIYCNNRNIMSLKHYSLKIPLSHLLINIFSLIILLIYQPQLKINLKKSSYLKKTLLHQMNLAIKI